ncbi:hypothetical protein J0H58_23110 [bacterium]|nr:hypothetical protein [bacterium]
MLLKGPFLVPPTFAADFGYRGRRRFLAMYWSPCGDEACFNDGEHCTRPADHVIDG